MSSTRTSGSVAHSALRLLVFDLDGTLIDSSRDLCNSINATLRHFGRPELPDSLIASYIGDGAAMLLRRSFGSSDESTVSAEDAALLDSALLYFLDFYRIHKLDFTRAYGGVLESLATIRERHPDLLMACLTNKPVRPSIEICDQLGLSPFFFQIYGGNSFATKKPHPEGLLALIAEASGLSTATKHENIRPDQAVLVGDSAIDVQTARNCGAGSIGCTFGLAPQSLDLFPPDQRADHPSDWPDLIASRLSTGIPRMANPSLHPVAS